MNVTDLVVLLASLLAVAGLGWFFFGPRKAGTAELAGGVQRVEVTVRGGYRPDLIRVRQGVPVEIVFDRQETGDCTSRVVFAGLATSAALPAYERTTVRLNPDKPGSYGFACGMNMVHGTLVVEPDGASGHGTGPAAARAAAEATTTAEGGERGTPPGGAVAPRDAEPGAGPSAAEVEAAQIAERRAEIADLTRRVGFGAVLTAPVLFAVMAHELFGVGWVPEVLLNRWLQLLLITPVMFYTGWPIHRTGWLTLAHRGADITA